MPLVPPYIESLRPYEAGRGIEEVQREYGLARISKLAPTRIRWVLLRWR